MIEPVIFLGPPGTGKTTALLDTVDLEMGNGVPPDRIGFMTFTKRGVEEATSRASNRFGIDRSSFRYFNTLHSAAFRHLGLNPNQTFTGRKLQEFGAAYQYELQGGLSSEDGTYTSFFCDFMILFFENLSRITRRPLEVVLSENDFLIPDPERAWKCIRDFRKFKADNGLFDFTDMLEEFVKIDDPPRLEVLMVDEAQDLSELQWAMVFQLAKYVKRLYIAGDDDQTIFTWAGASERFISMPGHVKLLEQSYRVPLNVQQLANRIIGRVVHRRKKRWFSRTELGSVTMLEGISLLDPKTLVSNGSVMFLGRTVKQLRQKLIPYCRGHGLPYRYFESTSIKPSYAQAIQAWEQLQEGKKIPPADALKIYNLLPSQGHSKKPGVLYGYKSRLANIAEMPDQPPLSMQELQYRYGLLIEGGPWEEVFVEIERREVDYIKRVMANGYDLLQRPDIHISTIHRVKGGQADTVVLLADTPKIGEKLATSNQDEEARVFYTAVTRTYRDLKIVHPDKRYHYEGLFI